MVTVFAEAQRCKTQDDGPKFGSRVQDWYPYRYGTVPSEAEARSRKRVLSDTLYDTAVSHEDHAIY